jgi:hypothetical protein
MQSHLEAVGEQLAERYILSGNLIGESGDDAREKLIEILGEKTVSNIRSD